MQNLKPKILIYKILRCELKILSIRNLFYQKFADVYQKNATSSSCSNYFFNARRHCLRQSKSFLVGVDVTHGNPDVLDLRGVI